MMDKFIQQIPKVELHVHLEGTIEPEMLFTLAQRNKIDLPYKTIMEVKRAFSQLDNLQDFLKLYYQGMKVLINEKDFYDVTFAYLKKCKEMNVLHLELFFDPQAHTKRGVPIASVIHGIHKALQDGREKFGITSKLIMCILRDESVEFAMQTLQDVLPYKEIIAGIGLDSDEINHPPSKFIQVFKKAKEYGFHLTAHGGHDGDAHPYVSELLQLDVNRVDHGVTIIQDEELMKEFKRRDLPFTVCPISNVKIGPFKKMEHHPFKKMFDFGLKVTLNSDDPSYLNASLVDNFVEIAKVFCLTKEEIVQIVKNSIDASFISNEEKERLHMKLNAFLREFNEL